MDADLQWDIFVFRWIHNYEYIIRKTAHWKAIILTGFATLYPYPARGKNDTDKVRQPSQIFAHFKYIS